jgi:hypothetical protein
MNFLNTIASLLDAIPPELKTTVAMLFGLGGFFWMVWDKISEARRAKLDANISLRQIAQDERRTGVDITAQQTETQLRISEAQQQAASYLAERIEGYTEKLRQVGELFDEIENLVADECSADKILRLIRKSRRELGL